MKTYLSHDERQISTFFAICYGLVDNLLGEHADNLSPKEVKALRYTHTYLGKYIEALTERVGVQEGERIYKLARDNVVELKPKKYDGQLVVDKDCMEEVARMALEANCFGCKKNWRECALYEFMKKLGVGSTNDTQGKCEFWYDEN